MEIIGVQWAMAEATRDPQWVSGGGKPAELMAAYLAVAQLGPLLLLGLFGGVAADRMNRKRLLIASQVMRMLIASALCALAYAGLISPIWLVLGALDGCAMAFNIPAWQVLTPRLVPREDLAQAITLNGLQFNLARAVGPAVGGVLLAVGDVGLLFLLNAISFLAVIAAVATTPSTPVDRSQQHSNPWNSLREAFHVVLQHPGIRHTTISISIFSMFATPVLRYMPLLMKDVYLPNAPEHVQERWYGLLLGCMGLGAVTGALTVKRFPAWYPRHHFVPLSIVCCGLSLVFYALCTSLAPACIAIFLVGIFWMWAFNAAFAAIQLLVTDTQRGRVLAIVNVIGFGVMPLGALAVGWIALLAVSSESNPVGIRIGLGVLALAIVILGAIWLTWRVPEVDGLRPGEPGYDRSPGLLRGIFAQSHRPEASPPATPPSPVASQVGSQGPA
jgi:MFS family permease